MQKSPYYSVNNNNDVNNNFNNPVLGSFITTSMDLWQQSGRVWIEIYKEVAVSSVKIHNSWSDTLWTALGTKEDQSTENLSYHHHDVCKNKKKIRALVLQGGGALGSFQAGAFKALYEN
jgi:hypothetical protein